ncbi:hypothetical protein M3Y99_01161900 [Aphelenchoides fujianensis]|nr:hypothetical protein M3Y99_01161900 [Aphelenchoides fujianensis]
MDTSVLSNRSEITPSPLFSERVLSPLTANGRRLSPPDSDLSLFDDLSMASTLTAASQRRGTSERRRSTMSPIVEGVASTTVRGMGEVPVIALQLVLSTFSFQELARLRRVHPICGQLLNSGYYDLIHRADVLLTDCQRRANAESKLQRPLQVLTHLQVHVLNPVDMLRAAMDEGVLCFPYGELLDKVGDLLDRVESVMGMSEGGRGWRCWDIEQLKTQNAQLKKDNRELKQLCARLENRIEMIERKFKTMARLLQ